MRRPLRTCTPLVALALTLAACSNAADSRTDDILRVVGPQEVHSLAPAASDGVFTRLEVAETLVTADEAGEITPGLATGWEVDDDGTTWTFDLIADVTFHDGTPLTPESAVAAMTHTAAEAASPLSDAPIEEIRPTDDGLEFFLASPYPALPAVLTHYSASVLAPASYDDEGHVTAVIGTGPYRIDKLRLPASVDVVRFDGWRGEAPAIERINFESVGRAEARALTASSRQADVVFRLEPAGVQRVESADGVAMASVLQPRTLLLKVNLDHPILGDVDVRRALSLALDRETMAQAVLREPDLGATQLLPPSLDQWTADIAPLTHDADAAATLLEEAGWTLGDDGVRTKDRERLALTLTTYPDRPELPALATAIQAAAKQIGIHIEVDSTNSSEIPARHADGSLDLALLARHFALVAEPLVTVSQALGEGGDDWGAMNWHAPQVDTAIEALLAGADNAQADQQRTTIVTAVQEQLPLIPVAWYRMNAAVSDRVDGFVMDPLETSWRLSSLRWAS